MKNIIVIVVALLALAVKSVLAIGPIPQLWDHANAKAGQNRTVYAVQMVLPEQPLSEVFEVVTIANATDPIDVATELLPSQSKITRGTTRRTGTLFGRMRLASGLGRRLIRLLAVL